MILSGKDIRKSYGDIDVLNGVNLDIEEGEIISIVGASGAGKTTLLQILGTLDRPTSGDVTIKGNSIMGLSDKKVALFRNQNIGFVFQFHHLLPEFTARENAAMPAFIGKIGKDEALKKADQLLDRLGLSDRINNKPSQLSGGEQQRVAVARALINDPAIVLADEPSGNLDSKSAGELHNLFFELRDEFRQTFVVVTHNEELANVADRKLTIKDGIILA